MIDVVLYFLLGNLRQKKGNVRVVAIKENIQKGQEERERNKLL